MSPGYITWWRFSRIPTAQAGLAWISLCALLAIFAYFVIPDRTQHANHQQLEVATHAPGTRMTFIHVTKNQPHQKPGFLSRLISGSPLPYNTIPVQDHSIDRQWIHYETYAGEPGYPGMEGRYHLADVLFAVDLHEDFIRQEGELLLITDLYGDQHRLTLEEMRRQVEDKHIRERVFWLGTDRFGRDMLSQLVLGIRVSLSVGFIAVFISLVIGISLGSLAGFFRGWLDQFIVWLINVVWSVPTLLLAIAITFALGKGFWQVFVAVGLTMWVEVARVVRGQVLSVREKEYVESARALGLGSLRIIRRHILPVVMGPVIVISAANFASAILIEAGLSFLGIGVQPPMPSWGNMIRAHYGFIILDKAYLAILPGLAIMLLVLAFMLTGNGLRDALDRSAKE